MAYEIFTPGVNRALRQLNEFGTKKSIPQLYNFNVSKATIYEYLLAMFFIDYYMHVHAFFCDCSMPIGVFEKTLYIDLM